MLRAWRNAAGFEGRSSVRSWLYRIATNVCIDMQRQVQRRARPMEMGPSSAPVESLLGPMLPEATWITPIPDAAVAPEGVDPAEVAEYRESIRLAFVAALQHLPARQRASLILCEVLRWQASEVAELLDMSVPAVNSSLQRARATLRDLPTEPGPATLDVADAELLERYVDAFERYDIDRLVTLLHEDAVQSMPPFAMWLRGAENIGRWMVEPGPSACRGSRLLATSANGCPAFGQYKPDPAGGHAPVGPAGARDLRRPDRRDAVLPRLPRPRAALPRVRPAPAPRRLARPGRAATPDRARRRRARRVAPSRRASSAIRAMSSTAARSGRPAPREHMARHLATVGGHDRDPAPELDLSHRVVDGARPAISSSRDESAAPCQPSEQVTDHPHETEQTMTTRDHAPIGSPCWVDLWTSDVDGSRAFYSERVRLGGGRAERGVRRLLHVPARRRARSPAAWATWAT